MKSCSNLPTFKNHNREIKRVKKSLVINIRFVTIRKKLSQSNNFPAKEIADSTTALTLWFELRREHLQYLSI